ncbi:MAG: hypothetical protein M0020_11330, partial [Actinomycetota bacterium]|nr:hypothetical protein [Actinomycetota bacterium]
MGGFRSGLVALAVLAVSPGGTGAGVDTYAAAPSAVGTVPAPSAGVYTPLAPIRICDTRPNNPSHLSGPSAQCTGKTLGAGSTLTVGVAGTDVAGTGAGFGVPAGATAAVLNVTAVDPAGAGYLTVWPAGAPRPTTSNVNYGPGRTVPNLVQVGLGPQGQVSIYASAPTDTAVDLQGYSDTVATRSGPIAGLYDGLASPARICDTRPNNPSHLSGPSAQCTGKTLGAGSTLTVGVAGTDVAGTGAGFGVPAGATAAVTDVTAIHPGTVTYLEAYPGPSRPTASDLNPAAGSVEANLAVITLSPAGTVELYNSAGPVNVAIDVEGYYLAPPANTITTRVGGPPSGEKATAIALSPFGVATDPAGDVFIEDRTNSVVYQVSPTGTDTVAAGDLVGDGCRATAAALDLNGGLAPDGVAVDAHGDLLIVDSHHGRVRMVAASDCSSSCPYGLASTTAGDIYTVAGGGPGNIFLSNSGVPATAAALAPSGIAVDSTGDLLIADFHWVKMVAASNCSSSCPYGLASTTAGDIYTVAGDGASGSSGDGGPATAATLGAPEGIAVDAQGNLLIADTGDNLVRIV